MKEGPTEINGGKIDTLPLSPHPDPPLSRGGRTPTSPAKGRKGVKSINLPPQQLIATDNSGTTRALHTKADALSRANVRVVTGIGCGIRTTRI
jgi:hypothetical protein